MEVFRTLVSLSLLQRSLSETQSICTGDLQPAKYVPLNSNASVSCPSFIAAEMDFSLFKGTHEVISVYVRRNNNSISKDRKGSYEDFFADLRVNADNSVSFFLVGVSLNSTDIYTCEASIKYPPPFKKVQHTPQTVVFVEDVAVDNHDGCNPSKTILWAVFGATAFYGLLMTCIILILKIKLTKANWPLKNKQCRRKRQGVQHPSLQAFYTVT